MRKILLLAVLALALPTAMFAGSSVDYTNSRGTLSGSSAGLSLSGSVLIAVNGWNGGALLTGSDLGNVSFSTGALTSGDTISSISSGDTSARVEVAEPGSLSLLGTALIALAGLVRHKRNS
jgi:hypothetical protein